MGFEWDEESKGINFLKHGVRMPEAIPVFDDPYAVTVTDDDSDPDEQRFVTIGMGATGRLLVVVCTWFSAGTCGYNPDVLAALECLTLVVRKMTDRNLQARFVGELL